MCCGDCQHMGQHMTEIKIYDSTYLSGLRQNGFLFKNAKISHKSKNFARDQNAFYWNLSESDFNGTKHKV